MSTIFKDTPITFIRPQEGGLRQAQIGAIWALSAHAMQKSDPAQAILPTGTGKSTVITALPFALRSGRILVITPSQIVRRQINREFRSLHQLRARKVIDETAPRLEVRSLGRRLSSVEEWNMLRAFDVVVTTPQCASPRYAGVVAPPPGIFDLIIVDEAHHEPAETWRVLLESFPEVPRLLLTATPFRRDRQSITGEIVYWYSMREAIRDGVYAPVHFRPVTPGPTESNDEALCRTALTRLNSQEHLAAGSQLVVRANTIREAHRLRGLYADMGLDIIVLTSESTNAEFAKTIASLEAGDARGVAVVGVLTEGFDLPRLKIAAYHQKHRSLGATLQFIGRLARTSENELVVPELLAVPEVISEQMGDLYAQDASWSEIIPRIADAAVAEERARRSYVKEFEGKEAQYSRAALQPTRAIQCFKFDRTPDVVMTWPATGPKKIVRSPVFDYSPDLTGEMMFAVTRDVVHPIWLNSDALDSYEYQLHLGVIHAERGYVFLSTGSEASRKELLGLLGCKNPVEVDGERLAAVLREMKVEAYTGFGMRPPQELIDRGVSYQMFAGRNAEQGLVEANSAGASAGHLIGRYREGTEWRQMSVSLEHARLREMGVTSLLDFRNWCGEVARMLDEAPLAETPPNLPLNVRRSFSSYPRNAISIELPHELFGGAAELWLDKERVNALDVTVRVRSSPEAVIVGFVREKSIVGTVQIDVNGVVSPRRGDLRVQIEEEVEPLTDFLNFHRAVLRFADGSVVTGKSLTPPVSMAPYLRDDIFETWDWKDVDLRREALPARRKFRENILERCARDLRQRFPDGFLIVDDGAGEISDLIMLRFDHERMLSIVLAHCKWSTSDTPGRRLNDVYQVLCQVMRSVRWTSATVLLPEIQRRLDARSQTKLLHGSRADLNRSIELFANRGILSVRVWAVQPGVAVAQMPAWLEGRNLIAACDSVLSQRKAAFSFIGS